jgi:methionyl-tRNA formyltransferase
MMKIVFMGTPDFAVPTLRRLQESRHDIVAVVTAPDKPAGRGHNIVPSAVKNTAESLNLPVYQPVQLKDPDFIKRLRRLDADMFVVVAFRILPPEVFNLPRFHTINLHASLLPRYRGAAPINWALIHGETTTGVTTFVIDEKVDTGHILLQKSVPIDIDDTAGDLWQRLSEIGADLVLETLEGFEAGTLTPSVQTGTPTKAPKIEKSLGYLNWNTAAYHLHNLIRGLSPVPGCTVIFRDKRVKILQSRLTDEPGTLQEPGTVVYAGKKGPLKVQTGEGLLELLRLQPAGKRPLDAGEFVRGYRISPQDRFFSLS